MPPYLHRGRVAFHETDAAGIVHFSQYFRYAEEAETHALAACGFSPTGYAYPRIHARADYQSPLRFWDEYAIRASLEHIGNSSLQWRFEISNAQGPCATVCCTTARRTPQNEPAPYSESERHALQALLECPRLEGNGAHFEKK